MPGSTSTMKSENRDVVTIRKGCVKPVQMYYESAVSCYRHIGLQPHILIIKNVLTTLTCVTKEVQKIPDIPPIFKLYLERIRYLKNIFESTFETYVYLQEYLPLSKKFLSVDSLIKYQGVQYYRGEKGRVYRLF